MGQLRGLAGGQVTLFDFVSPVIAGLVAAGALWLFDAIRSHSQQEEAPMESLLGKTVRCRVTRFEGMAVGRFEYLNGCIRYSVLAPGKDGAAPVDAVFDEEQLDLVEGGASYYDTGKPVQTGGDRPAPPARTTG